jgi:hypothetical protein
MAVVAMHILRLSPGSDFVCQLHELPPVCLSVGDSPLPVGVMKKAVRNSLPEHVFDEHTVRDELGNVRLVRAGERAVGGLELHRNKAVIRLDEVVRFASQPEPV